MEMALYYPELGYYRRSAPMDDFYTSADVNPIFGKILARFIYDEWKNGLKTEENFSIVELGAGWGKLASDIIEWLSANAPDCFNKLKYTCVESSGLRRKKCSELNAKFGNKVEIRQDFGFAERSISGIVLSNEFFDAIPFDRVVKQNGRLREVFIDDTLKEITLTPSKDISEYFDWLGHEPPEGCRGEAHPPLRSWMRKIAKALRKGTILSVDYGYVSQELYSDIRPEGTALCHFRHETNREFYKNIGLQDITAHINFTTLVKEAKTWGMESSPLRTQSEFLIDNGLAEMLDAIRSEIDPRKNLKASSAVKSLIHPEGMGGVFKVLVQRK